MSNQLPELIDPLYLVRKGQRLQGRVPLVSMPRLTDVLYRAEGEAGIDLSFRKEGKIACVTGRLGAELSLQCQVCLEPIRWVVESGVQLGIVSSIDEALLLPESYEPLLIDEQKTALKDIVEDELILALPLIPRHSECYMSVEVSEGCAANENPFALLAKLRESGGN